MIDNSFKTLIDSFDEVLILLPLNPSLDHVASGLSFYLSFLGSGKSASISCPSQMIAEFSRLIGIDKVGANLGNKNLTIKFVNYNAEDIDKVKADVENGLFTLFISPKSGKKSPTKDQIDIDYSGNSGGLVIMIGGDDDQSFPSITTPMFQGAKLIHVGTEVLKLTNDKLELLSFARPASSISELTAFILKDGGFVIDQDIASNLLSGIEENSDDFKNPNVSADTFEIFAELLKLGGVRTKKVPVGTFPQGAIPKTPYTQKLNQVTSQQVNQASVVTDRQLTPEEAEKELDQEIPPSWSEPKIFTGTSVS